MSNGGGEHAHPLRGLDGVKARQSAAEICKCRHHSTYSTYKRNDSFQQGRRDAAQSKSRRPRAIPAPEILSSDFTPHIRNGPIADQNCWENLPPLSARTGREQVQQNCPHTTYSITSSAI